jgi:hypothetical protein
LSAPFLACGGRVDKPSCRDWDFNVGSFIVGTGGGRPHLPCFAGTKAHRKPKMAATASNENEDGPRLTQGQMLEKLMREKAAKEKKIDDELNQIPLFMDNDVPEDQVRGDRNTISKKNKR